LIKRIFIIFLLAGNLLHAVENGFGIEYYKIRDIKTKKTAFVSTLLPKIEKAEKQILSDRAFIKKFFHKFLFTYSFKARYDLVRLIKIAKRYRIKEMYNEHEYLEKIDVIPVSLVLAQSAIESAWGESRFARKGNNLFGEWTWGKKGMVPSDRDEDATHRLRIFNTLDDSISRYMLNLNRHRSYKKFRTLRAKKRLMNEKFTGLEAAGTMENYSQMRGEYTKLIKQVIAANGFMGYEVATPNILALQ